MLQILTVLSQESRSLVFILELQTLAEEVED